ncbi:MAG: LEA type 2 family protein [Bacteroidetes bacterium]|nr:LEA type 2 family protein [Bacteroidota bacterium]
MLFLLSLLWYSCNTEAIEPKFQRVENIEIIDLNANKVSIIGEAVLYNPNPVSIFLDSIELDAFANELKVGHISQTKRSEISKKSEFAIPLSLEFNPNSLVNDNLFSLLESAFNAYALQKIELEFKGYASFDVKGFRFKVPISYSDEILLKDE